MPKEPLTEDEERTLLEAAAAMGDYQDGEQGVRVNAERAILFFLDTGAHPSVLALERHRLRVEREGEKVLIVWDRPKKTGRMAYTRILASKRLSPWIEEWVSAPRPKYRQYWREICQELARRIEGSDAPKYSGLASKNLCPLALRHTFGIRLLDRTKNPEIVRQLMNCDRSTLDYYLKLRGVMVDSALEATGW